MKWRGLTTENPPFGEVPPKGKMSPEAHSPKADMEDTEGTEGGG
jgi:hypothetical protein